uniref:Uncharacterized protein n=1 Tax=Tanacetum cinerariifolium TaxID=118510 RepID=A0A699HGG3_TANCI|nr:hypothetical protein [Tanacetum cinerariifolium]
MPPVNAAGHRSTAVNATGHLSTAADHGGDRRSTVVVNDGRRWRPLLTAAGPPLTSTGPPSTVVGGPVNERVRVGSGSGLGRVRVGSATWHPRGS